MEIDSEKEKIWYSHKLEVRRMLYEKLLLGAIIAIVGLFANMFFEKYKDQLGQERFIQEKKLEAISEVRISFNDLHSTYMNWTVNDCRDIPADYNDQYLKLVNNYIAVINKNSLLLSKSFLDKQVSYVLWIYQGIYYSDIAKSVNYREFAFDVADAFDCECRIQLGFKTPTNYKPFKFVDATWAEVENMRINSYFMENYIKWVEGRKK
jgi:hypothetical protein